MLNHRERSAGQGGRGLGRGVGQEGALRVGEGWVQAGAIPEDSGRQGHVKSHLLCGFAWNSVRTRSPGVTWRTWPSVLFAVAPQSQPPKVWTGEADTSAHLHGPQATDAKAVSELLWTTGPLPPSLPIAAGRIPALPTTAPRLSRPQSVNTSRCLQVTPILLPSHEPPFILPGNLVSVPARSKDHHGSLACPPPIAPRVGRMPPLAPLAS